VAFVYTKVVNFFCFFCGAGETSWGQIFLTYCYNYKTLEKQGAGMLLSRIGSILLGEIGGFMARAANVSTCSETQCSKGHASKPVCPWQRLMGRRGRAVDGDLGQGGFIVVRYSPKIFAAILSVIFLSLVDGALTLFLIDCGASELNPVMAYFLGYGPLVFFVAKYLLTCVPLVFILLHKQVTLLGTRVKAEALFLWLAIPYVLVVYWEFYLILRVL
jgi:hypothetical protein